MPRPTSATSIAPNPRMIATLMLGAALALMPIIGFAQTAPATLATTPDGEVAQATAVVKAADGTELGTVTASDTASGALHVIVNLEHLPEGQHAIHIHETGVCEGPDFKSAGGHLAGGKKHGILEPGGMHMGDLPNVDATMGIVTQEFFMPGVKVADLMDADGAAFVVHGGTDDYISQPAGNAGDRIACGVFSDTPATN